LDFEQIRVVLKAEARKAAAEENFQQAYALARQTVQNISSQIDSSDPNRHAALHW
jgi:hypothetical protein